MAQTSSKLGGYSQCPRISEKSFGIESGEAQSKSDAITIRSTLSGAEKAHHRGEPLEDASQSRQSFASSTSIWGACLEYSGGCFRSSCNVPRSGETDQPLVEPAFVDILRETLHFSLHCLRMGAFALFLFVFLVTMRVITYLFMIAAGVVRTMALVLRVFWIWMSLNLVVYVFWRLYS